MVMMGPYGLWKEPVEKRLGQCRQAGQQAGGTDLNYELTIAEERGRRQQAATAANENVRDLISVISIQNKLGAWCDPLNGIQVVCKMKKMTCSGSEPLDHCTYRRQQDTILTEQKRIMRKMHAENFIYYFVRETERKRDLEGGILGVTGLSFSSIHAKNLIHVQRKSHLH